MRTIRIILAAAAAAGALAVGGAVFAQGLQKPQPKPEAAEKHEHRGERHQHRQGAKDHDCGGEHRHQHGRRS